MSWVGGTLTAYNKGALVSAPVQFMVPAPHTGQRCASCQNSDRLGFVHGRNLLRGIAQLGQHFVGVLAQQR